MLRANSKISKAVCEPSRPLAAAWVRGSQDGFSAREPKPTVALRGWDRALDVAGDATELKCTSEEFLFSFWERCERPFQRSVSVRRDLLSLYFSWRPLGKPICRALVGRACGWGGSIPGLQTESGRGGEGFGWDQPPDPWRWAPCPPGAGAAPPHWPGHMGLRGQTLCSLHLGAESQGPEVLLPQHARPFSGSLQLGEQRSVVGARGLWPGTSLVVQWLRIHLPMQGTRV